MNISEEDKYRLLQMGKRLTEGLTLSKEKAKLIVTELQEAGEIIGIPLTENNHKQNHKNVA